MTRLPLVITGCGHVGAHGQGLSGLTAALAAGLPRVTAIDREAVNRLLPKLRGRAPARLAATLASQDFVPVLAAATARRLSLPSRLALVACRLALRDAGLADEPAANPLAGPTLGIALGTAFGTAVFTERLVRELLADPATASPFLFAESVANAPAAQAAIALRAQGPNVTVCQREASGVLAIAQAAANLNAGRVPAMLAGEVDEASALIHGLLDHLGALAYPSDPLATADADCGESARPFAADRNGFLLGEGATAVLVETAQSARARGAQVMALLLAAGSAFDPSASATNWGTGAEGLAAGLLRTLDRAGITPSEVDVVVSGASGSLRGDALEARVLQHVFADALPPVVAPKMVTGEYGGGLIAASLAIFRASLGAADGEGSANTIAFAQQPNWHIDPSLGVTPFSGILASPRVVLTTALGAGGAAGFLVLAAPGR